LKNQQSPQLIGRHIAYYIDSCQCLTFDSILTSDVQTRFIAHTAAAPNFGNKDLVVWNRFQVVNQSNRHWQLVVDNYSLDTLEYYVPDSSGSYQKMMSGRSQPHNQRKYRTGVYVFDLSIAPGDTLVFYLKVHSYFMQYPLFVMSREEFISTYHRRDRMEGFYYGFLLFLVLYNLFLFFSVRDKSYLYYIAYVIFNGLMIAQLKGSIAEIWGERFHFMWQYAPAVIAICSSITFVFTQHILETKKNAPRLHKVLGNIFIPAFLLIALISAAGYNLLASTLNQLTGLIGLVVMYATAIYIYRQGYRFARFYIAACWAYFAGVVVFVLKAFTILPYSVYTNNAIEIGSTIQMIMFAFTLADKMNSYKKERAKAQTDLLDSLRENERLVREQNKELEIKVTERTAELQETLHALEDSQEELQRKNALISKEMERSDKLLLNILPEKVAEELKSKGHADATYFDQVTVLFTDFRGFTQLSEQLSPQQLIAEINFCFSAFDRIMDRYGVEKIKTIGDAYMAVGGLPTPNKTHAEDVVRAALDIQRFMQQQREEREARGELFFDIRIGVHSGPVVAGIVGTKKFQYDVWGDTVNTASRMESSGEVGKVNISGHTHDRVRDLFQFHYRGKVEAKGKGEIDMYFVYDK